jgi:diphosphomevalonate decarboxylase
LSKVTASAPANIAFIKYWGAHDLERALPANASISMTLEACRSTSTVEARPEPGRDEIWLADEHGALRPADPPFARRVLAHLETLRQRLGFGGSFKVATRNSFPSSAGMASSASGFSALAVAVTRCLDRPADPTLLSRLARASGSASAARSVLGGYVELPAGDVDDVAAFGLAPADHWALADLVAIVETGAKEVSSLDGHKLAPSSPYYATRQQRLPAKLAAVRAALAARDLDRLGPIVEEEAIDLHLIAMSSTPPIFYWAPATLAVLARLRALRKAGLGAWGTLDAGANVHVICEAADAAEISKALAAVPGVEQVLADRVGQGPRLDEPALF